MYDEPETMVRLWANELLTVVEFGESVSLQMVYECVMAMRES